MTARYECHSPTNLCQRFPPDLSRQYDGCRTRWHVCSQRRGEFRPQSRVYLTPVRSGNGELAIVVSTDAIELTLKTSRSLVRSNLQAAIFSLSFLAWRCRVNTFRLPCLTILVWIAATALRLDRKHHESVTQNVRRRCSSRRQLLDCITHGVIEVVQHLPV